MRACYIVNEGQSAIFWELNVKLQLNVVRYGG